jgi:hypothetical protein
MTCNAPIECLVCPRSKTPDVIGGILRGIHGK